MASDSDSGPRRLRDRSFRIVEDIVYFLVALLLVAGALMLVVKAAYDLVRGIDDGVESAVRTALDTLLLVFILVELLGAVQATVKERKLLAEPFLLIGMIASIKQIVVVSTEADIVGERDRFQQAMIEVGVLGFLIVALSVATLLLRRKEREPKE